MITNKEVNRALTLLPEVVAYIEESAADGIPTAGANLSIKKKQAFRHIVKIMASHQLTIAQSNKD